MDAQLEAGLCEGTGQSETVHPCGRSNLRCLDHEGMSEKATTQFRPAHLAA